MPPVNAYFKFRVFLSHSNHDKEIVGQIYERVTSLGMYCYVDNRDSRAGEYIPKMLKDEIDNCHVLVAIYSKKGFASHWVHEEVGMAYYAEKAIIALCTPDINLSQLQTQVGKKAIVVRPEATGEAIEQLSENLSRLRLKNRLLIAGWTFGALLLWRYLNKKKAKQP